MPEAKPVGFVAFFLIWAKLQGWKVPLLHARICHWLETCDAPVRVLMVFRGASKSTIYAVYKAWKLYRDRQNRSLIWAADDKLATKLTRDTLNVLRRHPLCGGMLPRKPGAQSFWVNGAADARNPSMEAVGVSSNSTGSRADAVDFDDIEVPKNIKTPEARLNLRLKIEESTHIAVPGAPKTYIGTPHTHDSIYTEQIAGGAAVLKIPLFDHHVRYGAEKTSLALRLPLPFAPGEDGLYVFTGIGKPARLLERGRDYRVESGAVVFPRPPGVLVDIYAGCAWPERFTREDLLQRRRDTRTINGWDSQYQLEAKPLTDVRLDPSRIKAYDVEPTLQMANRQVSMWLGAVKITACSLRWDPSSGKLHSDVSAAVLDLQDDFGNHYLHRALALTGQIAETSADGRTITGGQVMQLCDLVEQFQVPRVVIETNGIGGFAPSFLRMAIKQRRLACGVTEEPSVANKNKRILEALDPLVGSGLAWAHVDVLEGPLWDQMKEWNPAVPEQPDDLLDAWSGAVTDQPVKVGKLVRNLDPARADHWHPAGGVFEVSLED